MLRLQLDLLKGNACFHCDGCILKIDVASTVELGEIEKQLAGTFVWGGPTREARVAPLGHDGNALGQANFYGLLNRGRRFGEGNGQGLACEAATPIGAVGRHVGGVGKEVDGPLFERVCQARLQLHQ